MTYAIVYELDATLTATSYKFDSLSHAQKFVQTANVDVIVHVLHLGKNVRIEEFLDK